MSLTLFFWFDYVWFIYLHLFFGMSSVCSYSRHIYIFFYLLYAFGRLLWGYFQFYVSIDIPFLYSMNDVIFGLLLQGMKRRSVFVAACLFALIFSRTHGEGARFIYWMSVGFCSPLLCLLLYSSLGSAMVYWGRDFDFFICLLVPYVLFSLFYYNILPALSREILNFVSVLLITRDSFRSLFVFRYFREVLFLGQLTH